VDEQTIIDASVKSDGPILFSAWDCIGRYSLAIDNTHLIRISGGRTLYEDASLAKTENSVRLARLAMAPLHQINRYVDPETRVELVPIKKTVDG
jgi:hypothetical protein